MSEHLVPQLPQKLTLFCVFTQFGETSEPQFVVPLVVQTHLPALHEVPAPHWLLQAPQWLLLEDVFWQDAPQSCSPAPQEDWTQALFEQLYLAEDVFRSSQFVHPLPQHVFEPLRTQLIVAEVTPLPLF